MNSQAKYAHACALWAVGRALGGIAILALMLALTAGTAQASGPTVSHSIYTTQVILPNTCPTQQPEVIDLEVTYHNTVRMWFDQNYNLTRMDIDMKVHGQGKGEVTGTKYVWNGQVSSTIDDPPGLPYSYVGTQKLRLISADPTANQIYLSIFAIQIDADGNVTVIVGSDTKCVGGH